MILLSIQGKLKGRKQRIIDFFEDHWFLHFLSYSYYRWAFSGFQIGYPAMCTLNLHIFAEEL